ncbi:uncharacterized protein TRIADDRAFT_58273 [Trichoplax adhaerens]|uniref:t-SNARE coiled-coil homology domain-containing protein n=1 Tax=Trichoplax adhaerens TaxID=10228 RepID=B3S1C2_TRIAD|nr:hypothetical protein TRIADDRAFT_58273 [Trichoplax adhaerens]EDV23535.1 hypothetical protein TRIADDRAFT_58273 [Trichoplax adhaerens]|eukprot:XP_002114445.1 hypothetical protein TRIADDRAFT_58273 [Trichoplax adhaerens]
MSRGDFAANSTFANQPPGYGTLGGQGYLPGRGRSTFNTISQNISSAIAEINRNVTSLNRLSKQLGTTRDGTDLRVKLRDMQQSTNATINETTRLVRESSSSLDGFEKAEKLRFDKLKSDFMTAVKSYSTSQTKIAEKERATPLSSKRNYEVTHRGEDPYLAEEKQRLVEEEDRRQKLDNLKMQQQQLDEDTELIEERSRQIHAIEADIINVNEIFKDLAVIVQEQGEVIGTFSRHLLLKK